MSFLLSLRSRCLGLPRLASVAPPDPCQHDDEQHREAYYCTGATYPTLQQSPALPEEKSEKRNGHRPDDCPGQVVKYEGPPAHPGRPGKERREPSYSRHKAGEENRFIAVPREELFEARHSLSRKEHITAISL